MEERENEAFFIFYILLISSTNFIRHCMEKLKSFFTFKGIKVGLIFSSCDEFSRESTVHISSLLTSLNAASLKLFVYSYIVLTQHTKHKKQRKIWRIASWEFSIIHSTTQSFLRELKRVEVEWGMNVGQIIVRGSRRSKSEFPTLSSNSQHKPHESD